MCQHCGCVFTGSEDGRDEAAHAQPLVTRNVSLDTDHQTLTLMQGLLAKNDRAAQHNREHLDQHGVLAVNLMSSPGAGKTSLLEASIPALRTRYRVGVVEGDLATDNDARRIRALGVPAVQITTGNACHLDAMMLHDALHRLDLSQLDLLFIENVGNLVCPASFDLGQHHSAALLSVPEGDDKPQKYPVMFRAVELVLLTKTDLLQHSPEFDVQRAAESLHSIGCDAPLIAVSNRSGDGIRDWCQWLHARKELRSLHAPASVHAHSAALSDTALHG